LADEQKVVAYTCKFRITSLNFSDALRNHSSAEYLALYIDVHTMVSKITTQLL